VNNLSATSWRVQIIFDDDGPKPYGYFPSSPKQQSTCRRVTPRIPIPNQQIFALTSKCLMLSGEESQIIQESLV
jgi:hypothetical protein